LGLENRKWGEAYAKPETLKLQAGLTATPPFLLWMGVVAWSFPDLCLVSHLLQDFSSWLPPRAAAALCPALLQT
jgi:hypothetical protein